LQNTGKTYLNDNPDQSLFIVTGKTFKTEHLEFEEDSEVEDAELGHISDNKSDEYILDRVLSNFNDEELRKYANRLLFSLPEYNEQDPRKVKTIILDDWIMSGQQMRDTLDGVFEHIAPMDPEINLVVSSENRLFKGFESKHSAVPIKACFVSHAANHPYASEFGGAYLTAAHSTGDYPFEGSMEDIIDAVNKASQGEKFYMPPLTNIIRPYYSPNYRPYHIERLNLLRAMGGRSILSS